jgi:hypothetical protein
MGFSGFAHVHGAGEMLPERVKGFASCSDARLSWPEVTCCAAGFAAMPSVQTVQSAPQRGMANPQPRGAFFPDGPARGEREHELQEQQHASQ